MDSRLLSNLNAQAAGTRDPVVWAKAVCRAASHFAGHGKTEEALTAIGVVRGQFGKNLHFDIASWLMLAEGVLHYFKAQLPEAYDRIRRAYGLAIALQNNSAFPACAAWMAHLEFNDCKYDEMVKHLEEALTTATSTDHQAIARSSLVLATAYHLAGDFQLARPWYEKARLSAAAEGDDATISATLHNMATIRAGNIRLEDTFGSKPQSETRRVALEASSSLTYDYAIGHKGLDFLTHMLGGLISTIDGRYSEALSIFEKVNFEVMPKRLHALARVDQSWCLSQLGELEESRKTALEVPPLLAFVEDNDDLAYVNSRLRQISAVCGKPSEVEIYKSLADDALSKHRLFQTDLLSKLASINTRQQNKNPA